MAKLNYKLIVSILFRLYVAIKNYFTAPFEDYDGNWKGIIYYEEMRMRKEWIKFLGIIISMVTGIILLNVL